MSASTPQTLASVQARLASGATSARDLVLATCEAAARAGDLFITVDAEGARRSAEASDTRRRKRAALGPLDGVPVAVKDVIDVAGVPTTMASEQFRDVVPEQDAAVVASLKKAGASIVGKTNCHEFSLGIRGDAGAFGVVRNPHDPARVAGGSSSGSASAVAQGIVPAAVGTDTAGSVRVPAALCGVVGFKPTYALLDVTGTFPLAPSFDTLGFFGSDVADVRALLEATAPAQQETDRPTGSISFVALDDLRARVSSDAVGRPYDVVTSRVVAARGALPLVDGQAPDFTEAYRVVRSYEAYAVHASLLETTPEKYQPVTRGRLLAGADIPDDEAAAVTRWITHAEDVFQQHFRDDDVLVSPTVPVLAPPLDDADVDASNADLMSLCVPWNILGWPAVTLPMWTADTALPQSVQLIAKPGRDALLLHAAEQVESVLRDAGREPTSPHGHTREEKV